MFDSFRNCVVTSCTGVFVGLVGVVFYHYWEVPHIIILGAVMVIMPLLVMPFLGLWRLVKVIFRRHSSVPKRVAAAVAVAVALAAGWVIYLEVSPYVRDQWYVAEKTDQIREFVFWKGELDPNGDMRLRRRFRW